LIATTLASKSVRCFVDDLGFRRVDAAPLPSTVAAFLEQDVQGATAWADELIGLIDQLTAGTLPAWEGVGNAFALTLSPAAASIECLWGDDACTVTLAELRQSIVEWRNFIGDPIAR
jgi:hypothetical protein